MLLEVKDCLTIREAAQRNKYVRLLYSGGYRKSYILQEFPGVPVTNFAWKPIRSNNITLYKRVRGWMESIFR